MLLQKFVVTLLLTLTLAGCASKKEMYRRQQAAYMAGQQQGMAQSRLQPQMGPSVTVQGEVQHPLVAWNSGMTVVSAIATATYTAFMNPRLIQVIRNGEVIQEFKPIDLQQGYDMPVQPGDIIKVLP